MKKLRDERKAAGCCVYCGKPMDREGIYCKICVVKNNQMKKKIKLRYKEEGKCVNCLKVLDRQGWFCKSCINKSNHHARERTLERRKNGLCVQCGEEAYGYYYCQKCRDYRMDRWRRRGKKY